MATAADTRVFSEPGGRSQSQFATTVALAPTLAGIVLVFAPLRWSGASALWSLAGVALVAISVPLWRWSRRLRRLGLAVGADGVRIIGARGTQALPWAQIRRFTPGDAPAVTIAGRTIPAVCIELVDGREIVVDGLRVDPGLGSRTTAEERVRELCGQLEALRPNGVDRAPGRAAPARS